MPPFEREEDGEEEEEEEEEEEGDEEEDAPRVRAGGVEVGDDARSKLDAVGPDRASLLVAAAVEAPLPPLFDPRKSSATLLIPPSPCCALAGRPPCSVLVA